MAMYTPLPFVGKPLDQSEQQMRLVDLMYQAQLARIQKEQEARLQGANMFMNLGMQLPQILNTVEQNRIRQMQAEADVTRANAYQQYMQDQAELNRQQNLLKQQEAAYESVAGGRQIPLEAVAQFGPYGAGFEVTPLQDSVPQRSVTPSESVSLASLMRPEMDARPVGTLPSRPMGVSVLPGMAVETPTEFGGFATKPKSKEQLAAEEAAAKAEAERASIEALRRGMTPDQQRVFDLTQAMGGKNLSSDVMRAVMGIPPPETPQTITEMEAEDARKWLENNPGKTLVDYQAMVASRTRAPRDERPKGLTPAVELQQTRSLQADWDKASKEVRKLASEYGNMRDAYEQYAANPNNAGARNVATQVIINAFNTMIQPNSVVRESEYARTEEGVAYLDRVEAYLAKIIRGGSVIPDSELKALVDQSARFLEVRELASGLERTRRRLTNIVKKYDLGEENFDFTSPGAEVRANLPYIGNQGVNEIDADQLSKIPAPKEGVFYELPNGNRYYWSQGRWKPK